MRARPRIHAPRNHAVGAMATHRVASVMRASHLMHPEPISLLRYLTDCEAARRQATPVHPFCEYGLPLVAATSATFTHAARSGRFRYARLRSPPPDPPHPAPSLVNLRPIRFLHSAPRPASAVVSLPRQTKTQPGIQVLYSNHLGPCKVLFTIKVWPTGE